MDATIKFHPGSLLERDGEIAQIDDALQAARAGSGALVVIEGPGGIGKTELLMAARRRGAETGMTVASARGSELERELAFGVVRQLLEPIVAGADAGGRADLFTGAAALAEPLFALSSTSALSPVQREDQTFAVLHGLYWLCSNVAQPRPLLLAVDDAHWADLSSLRFLAYLAPRHEGLSLALVVAARPAETPAEEELLVRLATEPRNVAIAPAPLSHEAVATLLRSELLREPDDVFVGACHHATGGTPFLVRELVRELRAQHVEPVAAAAGRIEDLGPRTVARSVLVRVRRLGPGPLELAQAIAVLGTDAEPRRAARLAGVEESDVSGWVDALISSGVLRPGRPIESCIRSCGPPSTPRRPSASAPDCTRWPPSCWRRRRPLKSGSRAICWRPIRVGTLGRQSCCSGPGDAHSHAALLGRRLRIWSVRSPSSQLTSCSSMYCASLAAPRSRRGDGRHSRITLHGRCTRLATASGAQR